MICKGIRGEEGNVHLAAHLTQILGSLHKTPPAFEPHTGFGEGLGLLRAEGTVFHTHRRGEAALTGHSGAPEMLHSFPSYTRNPP